ncbi:MAG: hypothetical protein FWC73_13625 [Defluviitaleaceae bacterium]|nr:hypothetical protein [Defluviitaleaceae bacterium]
MKKPYVVGIAGGSASGKSTFCDQLEAALREHKLLIFHMDYYFKPKDKRPFVKSPINENMYIDDNHPETLDLPKLRQDLQSAINDAKVDIIIIEGLLVLADDEICNQLDLKLFMECRQDERIVRRLRRNMAKGLTFDEISNVYLDMVRFRHDEYVEPSKWKADIIVNGSASTEKALEIITYAIKTFGKNDKSHHGGQK